MSWTSTGGDLFERVLRLLRRHWQSMLLLVYLAMLVAFLLAELNVDAFARFRATNQVLLLIALLFLPFVLPAAAAALRKISLKISGQELELEFRELKQNLQSSHEDLHGRLATSEQILYPLVGGPDPGSASRLRERRLIVGAKEFVHNQLMAELLVHQTESVLGVRVERRIPNGGTLKNYADLSHGWIDLYVEYTGTGCLLLNVDHRGRTSADVLESLNAVSRPRHGIAWLQPFGASTDWRIVMRRSRASQFGITTIRDLALHAERLAFCGPIEWLNRRDAFQGLVRTYGLRFRRVEPCGFHDGYNHLERGLADVTFGLETDVELGDKDFAELEDSEQFFPRYLAVPVVRLEALEFVEGLGPALTAVGGLITTDQMKTMLARLGNRGDSVAERAFLARECLRGTGPAAASLSGSSL